MRTVISRSVFLRQLLLIAGLLSGSGGLNALAAEPLPSWKDSPARKAILDFVARVTDEKSPDFVPVEARIAVFDNDGTLWAEKPFYFQGVFALQQIKELAPAHPEWKLKLPFSAVLSGKLDELKAGGEKAILEIVMASHAGLTTDEFAKRVQDWIATARHPTTGRLYTQMVYQPMLELLAYLREQGFKTYIVSGGGIEFMRVWSEPAYGIPPEQVIGSTIRTKLEYRESGPVIERLPELDFNDDKTGKPLSINKFIGRRPILACGNSDGDYDMLRWTSAGSGARLGLLVHHTDAEREWAYDRDSIVGRLDKALTEAPERGWTVIDMKADWATIYPPLPAEKTGK